MFCKYSLSPFPTKINWMLGQKSVIAALLPRFHPLKSVKRPKNPERCVNAFRFLSFCILCCMIGVNDSSRLSFFLYARAGQMKVIAPPVMEKKGVKSGGLEVIGVFSCYTLGLHHSSFVPVFLDVHSMELVTFCCSHTWGKKTSSSINM